MKKGLCYLCVMMSLFCSGCSGCSKKEIHKLTENISNIQGLELSESQTDFQTSFVNQVSYEVSDIQWNGNEGTAEVIVTTPNLKVVIDEAIEMALQEVGITEYENMLEKAKANVSTIINSEDAEMLNVTIQMDVKKQEDGYVLISNSEFEDVINGNLERLFWEYLLEGLEDEE